MRRARAAARARHSTQSEAISQNASRNHRLGRLRTHGFRDYAPLPTGAVRLLGPIGRRSQPFQLRRWDASGGRDAAECQE